MPSSEVTYQPVHENAQCTIHCTGPCRASLRRINGEVDEEENVVAKEEDTKDDKSCSPELFEACTMEYVGTGTIQYYSTLLSVPILPTSPP